MKKGLPIGIHEFNELKASNAYYVDKTLLVKAWLDSISKVTLITRPRRFGKTLNMTMLREFFDNTKDSKALFEGLAVMDTPYVSEMNQWPVIYLSMRDCKGGRKDNLACVYQLLLQSIDDLPSLSGLSEIERFDLEQIKHVLQQRDFEKSYLTNKTLLFLSRLLYQYYGKKVIILIDEYDTPMITAYERGYYAEIQDFFSSLYGSALKDNPYLERAMVTGIHRIAKESIFSDLNNLKVCTVLDNQYQQYFGLTPAETAALLADYDLALDEAVQAMYDGYRFGKQEIYNPWSIINYVDTGSLETYWANTAGNVLIKDGILTADSLFHADFEQLITSGEVEAEAKLQTSFLEIREGSTLWGLLLNTGYVTSLGKVADMPEQSRLRIPNQEVKGAVFREIVAAYIGVQPPVLTNMFKGLLRKDIALFQRNYEQIILSKTSYYDAGEKAYHLLFLGMCVYLDESYRAFSNMEFGHGRPDIRLEARRPGLHHIIIEFKYGEDTEQLAREALVQIHEKQYYAGLSGEVLLLGIAHDGKACAIVDETINLS